MRARLPHYTTLLTYAPARTHASFRSVAASFALFSRFLFPLVTAALYSVSSHSLTLSLSLVYIYLIHYDDDDYAGVASGVKKSGFSFSLSPETDLRVCLCDLRSTHAVFLFLSDNEPFLSLLNPCDFAAAAAAVLPFFSYSCLVFCIPLSLFSLCLPHTTVSVR